MCMFCVCVCALVCPHRDEEIEQVLERRQLRDQLLHHFAERLEDGVVVDGRQVEAAKQCVCVTGMRAS